MSRFLRGFLTVVAGLVLCGLGALVMLRRQAISTSSGPTRLNDPIGQDLIDRFTALEARENKANQSIWAREIRAESCGRVFESLWDSLNAATNKFSVLASFSVGELLPGKFGSPRRLDPGIERREPEAVGPAWSGAHWRGFLEEIRRAGWELEQTEFRHTRFDTDNAGRPLQSRFFISAHLFHAAEPERAVVEGDVIVDWAPANAEDAPPRIRRIDASRLTITTRRGEPPFHPLLTEQIIPPEKSYFIDPLILHDLDGDGFSEIILAAKNLVYHRRDGDRYEPEPLCRYPPGLIFTGIIADFDGDGVADFLCAKFEGLVLFKGSPGGAFDQPGRLVWEAKPHLKYAQVLTCADIDHDGDLDVFLAQYKVPYTRGQMPTPYFDANDGDPAYLLLNDGHGEFTDATVAAGLEKKRWRRTYSASLVDLNGDGHPDLLVVSDFAGLDLYTNDGRGHFTDVTGAWIKEPHAFGMAHVLEDFNADGRLDLLMIGMNSPTADRLEHLGLNRPGPDSATHELGGPTNNATMRSRMTYGNRLYLAGPTNGFEQTSLNDSIAHTGWSWGCSAFDFDNDGFPDVYIANGHETKQSVRDYEAEFWLHDIYVAGSRDDVVATAYFAARFGRTRDRGWSFGGHEKNRLCLNQRGQSFVEAGYLMGVSLEEDSRCVVTDDLDGDGRMDLLVTTFEAWPQQKQTLHVFKNTLEDGGNWIGFRLQEHVGGESPIGARITVHHSGGVAVRHLVTGDSYRSQHANTLHFGLGRTVRVESAEIRWASGSSRVIDQPAINRYHWVLTPDVKQALP